MSEKPELSEAKDGWRATMSSCGRYRYHLSRLVSGGSGTVCWIMLNPSTADAWRDDATIRRLRGYTKNWGFGALDVVNLFAYRTPYPKELLRAADNGTDVVGPNNDRLIVAHTKAAELVVCAWGVGGGFRERGKAVMELLESAEVWPLYALGQTRGGHPVHPLRQPRSATLMPFRTM